MSKVKVSRIDDNNWNVSVECLRQKKIITFTVDNRDRAEQLKKLFLGQIS